MVQPRARRRHVLEIGRDADEAEIRRAYRARAMETHPDRAESADEFHEVQEAYRQAMQARQPQEAT